MGASWSRPIDMVLGGWQLGGILTAHSGFPLTVRVSGDPSGTGSRSVRANVNGTPDDPHLIGPGLQWLDNGTVANGAKLYTTPTAFTFGNTGVGIVPGPGMAPMDSSLNKQ